MYKLNIFNHNVQKYRIDYFRSKKSYVSSFPFSFFFFFFDRSRKSRDKIRVHRTLLFPLRSSSGHKLTVKLKNYNAGEARMNDDVHRWEKDKASKTLVD